MRKILRRAARLALSGEILIAKKLVNHYSKTMYLTLPLRQLAQLAEVYCWLDKLAPTT